jgi:hypothetical protein
MTNEKTHRNATAGMSGENRVLGEDFGKAVDEVHQTNGSCEQ